MPQVAICASCRRTVSTWHDVELGGDVWEPYCKDCPRPEGDSFTWLYRGCVIEQHWNPVAGFRPYLDSFVWAHEDYDGPEDKRCGFGETLADVCEDIDFKLEKGEYEQ